ncbi:hypothetical protein SEA_MISCHIEF19_42 [Streptomyces phage Mischief19]|nr:hypothetical protein SEA_MISCHIEF19_42 [Streptomyces phage Mischief19]
MTGRHAAPFGARTLPLGRPFGSIVQTLAPVDIASHRAARLTDANAHDRELFMAWFARGRSDELNHADTWAMHRALRETNEPVDEAGYLEGVASVRADRMAVRL